jgi:Ca-activated chloride channel family protein
MIYFQNLEFFWAFVLLLPILFLLKQKQKNINKIFAKDVIEKIQLKNQGLSKKIRDLLILLSFILLILALARPVIDNKPIKVKSSFVNMIAAIDISQSMFVDDIYPNRFEFAKIKFLSMLDFLKNTKVSLLGFSSDTFLISPLTEDFYSLRFLTKNLNTNSVSKKGTNILNILKTANELFKNEKKKILFLFTDGGDKDKFEDELEYAKKHNIFIYIYGIGTTKGGVIRQNNKILKDKNQNIVVLKLNENIKKLAINSGGAYMKQTLKNDDIKLLVDDILSKFKAKEKSQTLIKDKKELFYFPLIFAILLLFVSMFSLPQKKDIL